MAGNRTEPRSVSGTRSSGLPGVAGVPGREEQDRGKKIKVEISHLMEKQTCRFKKFSEFSEYLDHRLLKFKQQRENRECREEDASHTEADSENEGRLRFRNDGGRWAME